MATISAVIVPAKALRDGRHKVRISVAHNGETRYIVSDIVINSQKEFKNGQIVGRPDASMLNIKLRKQLINYQNTIDELPYVDGLSCSELVSEIKNPKNDKNRSIESVYEEYIDQSPAVDSTKSSYRVIWNYILGHFNVKAPIRSISHNSIRELMVSMQKYGLSNSTIRNYMNFMRSIVIFASKAGYAQFKVDPFLSIKLPKTDIRNAWLKIDEIKRIRDAKCKGVVSKARDLFMLSYYLGGINMVDLLQIKFSKDMKRIKYIRQKVKNRVSNDDFIEFDVPKEAKEIIPRIIGPDGLIVATETQRRECFCGLFRYCLPRLAKQVVENPSLDAPCGQVALTP